MTDTLVDAALPVTPTAQDTAAARGATPGRAAWGAVGPAFVVAVAYVDPGNFATNMAGGARYGYQLLWVIAVANVVAMFVQYLSAKLGVATGTNLPRLCRQRWPRPAVWLMWAQAELVVMATDLAEFVGAALALHLLFGLAMLPAGLVTAAVTCALLVAAPAGRRRFAVLIAALLSLIVVGFLWQAARAGLGGGVLSGLVPRLADRNSLLLASGIVGATVMPHVVYLHSGLTARPERRRPGVLRTLRADIGLALGIAGLANLAMLVVAAGVLHHRGGTFDTLTRIHAGLSDSLGAVVGLVFTLSLLVAGLASSCVGTCAGEMVMSGFLGVRVPAAVRRLVTMAPAIALLAAGVEPTTALVLSQVVLSFGLPCALVPLVVLTSRRGVMGSLVNRRPTLVLGIGTAALVCGLNVLLLIES
jgi:manganese transport protein